MRGWNRRCVRAFVRSIVYSTYRTRFRTMHKVRDEDHCRHNNRRSYTHVHTTHNGERGIRRVTSLTAFYTHVGQRLANNTWQNVMVLHGGSFWQKLLEQPTRHGQSLSDTSMEKRESSDRKSMTLVRVVDDGGGVSMCLLWLLLLFVSHSLDLSCCAAVP